MTTPTQPDTTPTAKVTAATLAGAAVTVLVSVSEHFGIDIPSDVAASLVVILVFAAGWIKRSRPGETDR